MFVNKSFKNAPKCSVSRKVEEGEDEVIHAHYLGTVLEVVSQGSFLTNIHVGLLYVPSEKSLIKVPLESINFE